MFEFGLIDEFLKLPHQQVETVSAQIGAEHVQMVDFRHLPTHCKFVALMPQWDFLNFLAEHGKRYKTFDLRMQAEATDLIEENGRIAGLIARTPDGALTIRADLVVGCDGRHSNVREKAGLKSDDYGAPMDVLWFRVSHKDGDSVDTFGHIEAGKLMVMFDRGDYWQCAYVIPKGGIERMKSEGLEAFRGQVVEMSPFLSDRVGELKTLGRRQTAQRHSRSAAEMVAAWAHLHRRCGACDVADRRGGHQHGGAGRGRRRQPACRTAPRGQAYGRGSSGHRRSTHSADALHAAAAAHRPAEDHQPRSGKPGAAEAAAPLEALRRLSDSAPHSGPTDRYRHSPEHVQHARSGARSSSGIHRASSRHRSSASA